MADDEWSEQGVIDLVERAVAEVVAVKGRGIAQANKLLHLKRSALVPVIVSFVAKALGGRLSAEASAATRGAQARAIVEHFRTTGVALRPELERVDPRQRSGAPLERGGTGWAAQ